MQDILKEFLQQLALSDKSKHLSVKLYKNGKPFKMSKRSGDFITAQDLLNEVNKDRLDLWC